MITFEIDGKRIKPGNIGDAIMQAVLRNLEAQIRERIGSIRDPETGEFPTIVMRGDSLENLQMHVEGSPELIALVRKRMDGGEDEEALADDEMPEVRRAFSCPTHLTMPRSPNASRWRCKRMASILGGTSGA